MGSILEMLKGRGQSADAGSQAGGKRQERKKTKAKPKATKVNRKLIGKEVEVSVAGVKQKGTYVDIQGTPFISSPIPQERGGGTQSQAIPANAKVKEIKVKKEKPLKSISKCNPTN